MSKTDPSPIENPEEEKKSRETKSTTKRVRQNGDKNAELVTQLDRERKRLISVVAGQELVISLVSRNLGEARKVVQDLATAMESQELDEAKELVQDLKANLGDISFTAKSQEALVARWQKNVNYYAGEAAYYKAHYE